MASTTAQNINIRDAGAPTAFPVLSGDTFYHGCIAVVAGTGYLENLDSSSLGAVPVVIDSINGNYDQAGTTSTGTGSVVNGSNLALCYTNGYIDSIPFNSDAAATSVGQIAYVKDNFTLTTDPKDGIMPFGIITKYYSSTKAEVKINSFATDGVFTFVDVLDGTTPTSSIMWTWANPIGDTVIIKDWHVAIITGCSSVISVSAGIAATSTTPAADLIATNALTLGTAGVYGPAKTTNFLNNIRWTSSQYFVISGSSVCSTAGGTSLLDAYIKIRYEVI